MPDAANRPRSKIPLLQRDDLTPRERARVGLAASWLLASGLAAIVALGSLTIWHLVRRGRLIRDGLKPPRITTEFDDELPPAQK